MCIVVLLHCSVDQTLLEDEPVPREADSLHSRCIIGFLSIMKGKLHFIWAQQVGHHSVPWCRNTQISEHDSILKYGSNTAAKQCLDKHTDWKV